MQLSFNGELLSPDRGLSETLPWGAVRVPGRNRRDTVNNPSLYEVSFTLVGQSMIDWFQRGWYTLTAEGSMSIETSIGWAQVIGEPTFSNNTGRRAAVNMTLEILEDTDYCFDESLLVIGEYFGDNFLRDKRILEAAINGN